MIEEVRPGRTLRLAGEPPVHPDGDSGIGSNRIPEAYNDRRGAAGPHPTTGGRAASGTLMEILG